MNKITCSNYFPVKSIAYCYFAETLNMFSQLNKYSTTKAFIYGENPFNQSIKNIDQEV